MRKFYIKYGKRFFDILLASLAFILLVPVFAIISFIIKIKLGSPILFKQERLGLHGTHYINYKFRTMTDARNAQGQLLNDAERLTGLGIFLRNYSLDELPELINVLKGDMSIVGPRPLVVRYFNRYTPIEIRRHEMKPGITGWAQINGRNLTTWEQRFSHDLWYIDHCSFLLDCLIIIRTMTVLLHGDGGVKAIIQLGEYMGNNRETKGN